VPEARELADATASALRILRSVRMTGTELRAAFARAQEIGLLDPEALRAARERVEWRPSLAMLDEVIQRSAPKR
jgi:hypothetical protein